MKRLFGAHRYVLDDTIFPLNLYYPGLFGKEGGENVYGQAAFVVLFRNHARLS